MDTSQSLSDFLEFLRQSQQDYSIAADIETTKSKETQDILHKIELDDIKYHEYAKLAKALKSIRNERREAKNIQLQLAPLVGWIKENQNVVRGLERLLGEVRKAETNIKNAHYYPRTEIVDEILENKENINGKN
jgi:hypothetical protein